MKQIIRSIIINAVAIYFASLLLAGVSYENSLKTLFLAALGLFLGSYIVRPVVKLVTLPINLITLGLFSWLIDVFILYLVTRFIPEFSISAFTFEGYNLEGFVIPSFYLTTFWAFVAVSFVVAFILNFLNWLCE